MWIVGKQTPQVSRKRQRRYVCYMYSNETIWEWLLSLWISMHNFPCLTRPCDEIINKQQTSLTHSDSICQLRIDSKKLAVSLNVYGWKLLDETQQIWKKCERTVVFNPSQQCKQSSASQITWECGHGFDFWLWWIFFATDAKSDNASAGCYYITTIKTARKTWTQ